MSPPPDNVGVTHFTVDGPVVCRPGCPVCALSAGEVPDPKDMAYPSSESLRRCKLTPERRAQAVRTREKPCHMDELVCALLNALEESEARAAKALRLIKLEGDGVINALEFENFAFQLGVECERMPRPYATKHELHEQVARLQEALRTQHRALDENDDAIFSGGIRQEIYGK